MKGVVLKPPIRSVIRQKPSYEQAAVSVSMIRVVADLAERIHQLVDFPAEASHVGEEGCRRYKQRYKAERFMKDITKVLFQMANNTPVSCG
jgi:hypothetical protein